MISRRIRRQKACNLPIKKNTSSEPNQVLLKDLADFEKVVQTLNELLSKEHPETFNSSWIQRRAPKCYRFIQKSVRTAFGPIDWDRVTGALERRFQRRWAPGRTRRSCVPYRNQSEVQRVLEQYRAQLYVFLAPSDRTDRRTRDIISVTLVRLAQYGNLSAKQEIMKLISYTIDDWIDRYPFLSRWRVYDAEIRRHLEGCIRRYRYTGSFLHYVFRTLECAGRGIRPLQAYSLDAPISDGSMCRINIFDPEMHVRVD
jgi:hypothetical protein